MSERRSRRTRGKRPEVVPPKPDENPDENPELEGDSLDDDSDKMAPGAIRGRRRGKRSRNKDPEKESSSSLSPPEQPEERLPNKKTGSTKTATKKRGRPRKGNTINRSRSPTPSQSSATSLVESASSDSVADGEVENNRDDDDDDDDKMESEDNIFDESDDDSNNEGDGDGDDAERDTEDDAPKEALTGRKKRVRRKKQTPVKPQAKSRRHIKAAAKKPSRSSSSSSGDSRRSSSDGSSSSDSSSPPSPVVIVRKKIGGRPGKSSKAAVNPRKKDPGPVKPFVCRGCGKSFTARGINAHEKRCMPVYTPRDSSSPDNTPDPSPQKKEVELGSDSEEEASADEAVFSVEDEETDLRAAPAPKPTFPCQYCGKYFKAQGISKHQKSCLKKLREKAKVAKRKGRTGEAAEGKGERTNKGRKSRAATSQAANTDADADSNGHSSWEDDVPTAENRKSADESSNDSDEGEAAEIANEDKDKTNHRKPSKADSSVVPKGRKRRKPPKKYQEEATRSSDAVSDTGEDADSSSSSVSSEEEPVRRKTKRSKTAIADDISNSEQNISKELGRAKVNRVDSLAMVAAVAPTTKTRKKPSAATAVGSALSSSNMVHGKDEKLAPPSKLPLKGKKKEKKKGASDNRSMASASANMAPITAFFPVATSTKPKTVSGKASPAGGDDDRNKSHSESSMELPLSTTGKEEDQSVKRKKLNSGATTIASKNKGKADDTRTRTNDGDYSSAIDGDAVSTRTKRLSSEGVSISSKTKKMRVGSSEINADEGDNGQNSGMVIAQAQVATGERGGLEGKKNAESSSKSVEPKRSTKALSKANEKAREKTVEPDGTRASADDHSVAEKRKSEKEQPTSVVAVSTRPTRRRKLTPKAAQAAAILVAKATTMKMKKDAVDVDESESNNSSPNKTAPSGTNLMGESELTKSRPEKNEVNMPGTERLDASDTVISGSDKKKPKVVDTAQKAASESDKIPSDVKQRKALDVEHISQPYTHELKPTESEHKPESEPNEPESDTKERKTPDAGDADRSERDTSKATSDVPNMPDVKDEGKSKPDGSTSTNCNPKLSDSEDKDKTEPSSSHPDDEETTELDGEHCVTAEPNSSTHHEDQPKGSDVEQESKSGSTSPQNPVQPAPQDTNHVTEASIQHQKGTGSIVEAAKNAAAATLAAFSLFSSKPKSDKDIMHSELEEDASMVIQERKEEKSTISIAVTNNEVHESKSTVPDTKLTTHDDEKVSDRNEVISAVATATSHSNPKGVEKGDESKDLATSVLKQNSEQTPFSTAIAGAPANGETHALTLSSKAEAHQNGKGESISSQGTNAVSMDIDKDTVEKGQMQTISEKNIPLVSDPKSLISMKDGAHDGENSMGQDKHVLVKRTDVAETRSVPAALNQTAVTCHDGSPTLADNTTDKMVATADQDSKKPQEIKIKPQVEKIALVGLSTSTENDHTRVKVHQGNGRNELASEPAELTKSLSQTSQGKDFAKVESKEANIVTNESQTRAITVVPEMKKPNDEEKQMSEEVQSIDKTRSESDPVIQQSSGSTMELESESATKLNLDNQLHIERQKDIGSKLMMPKEPDTDGVSRTGKDNVTKKKNTEIEIITAERGTPVNAPRCGDAAELSRKLNVEAIDSDKPNQDSATDSKSVDPSDLTFVKADKAIGNESTEQEDTVHSNSSFQQLQAVDGVKEVNAATVAVLEKLECDDAVHTESNEKDAEAKETVPTRTKTKTPDLSNKAETKTEMVVSGDKQSDGSRLPKQEKDIEADHELTASGESIHQVKSSVGRDALFVPTSLNNTNSSDDVKEIQDHSLKNLVTSSVAQQGEAEEQADDQNFSLSNAKNIDSDMGESKESIKATKISIGREPLSDSQLRTAVGDQRPELQEPLHETSDGHKNASPSSTRNPIALASAGNEDDSLVNGKVEEELDTVVDGDKTGKIEDVAAGKTIECSHEKEKEQAISTDALKLTAENDRNDTDPKEATRNDVNATLKFLVKSVESSLDNASTDVTEMDIDLSPKACSNVTLEGAHASTTLQPQIDTEGATRTEIHEQKAIDSALKTNAEVDSEASTKIEGQKRVDSALEPSAQVTVEGVTSMEVENVKNVDSVLKQIGNFDMEGATRMEVEESKDSISGRKQDDLTPTHSENTSSSSVEKPKVSWVAMSTLSSSSRPVKTVSPTTVYDCDKIDRVKTLLYTTGSQIHLGRGFERIFGMYWDAICLRLSSPLNRNAHKRCDRVISEFLKSRKLRKIHNKFIMSIMRRALKDRVPYTDVSEHVPLRWRHRVKVPQINTSRILPKKKFYPHFEELKESLLQISSVPHIDEKTPYKEVWDVPDDPTDKKERNPQEGPTEPIASSCIPGALVVDPFLRDTVEASDMKVSDCAMWLLTVALKEYIKNLLNDSIEYKKGLEKGELFPQSIHFPNVLASNSNKSKKISKGKASTATQEIMRKKQISSIDLFAALKMLPCGQPSSIGGSISRISLEQTLLSGFNSMQSFNAGVTFKAVQSFISSEITNSSKELKTEEKKLKPPYMTSVESRRDASRDTKSDREEDVKKTPNKTNVLESPNSSVPKMDAKASASATGIVSNIVNTPLVSNQPSGAMSTTDSMINTPLRVNNPPPASNVTPTAGPLPDISQGIEENNRDGSEVKIVKVTKPVEKVKIGMQPTQSGMQRSGAGRGAKNLAALMARAAGSNTQTESAESSKVGETPASAIARGGQGATTRTPATIPMAGRGASEPTRTSLPTLAPMYGGDSFANSSSASTTVLNSQKHIMEVSQQNMQIAKHDSVAEVGKKSLSLSQNSQSKPALADQTPNIEEKEAASKDTQFPVPPRQSVVPVRRGKGKGFGSKDLAAMRARSMTTTKPAEPGGDKIGGN